MRKGEGRVPGHELAVGNRAGEPALPADPMSYEHGTVACYLRRACRCDECRRAKATYRREYEVGPPRTVDVSCLGPALLEFYRTGLTLGEIARRAGVQPHTVSDIIAGRRRTARVDTAAKLAAFLRGEAL